MYPTTKTRFEAFSDGVFAIAITLLAIELHVPRLVSNTFAGGLQELAPLIPSILTFLLSFMTIAIFWVNHHQLTQTMGPLRRRTLWTNMLFLLCITLMPFGTNVLGTNPSHPLSLVTYTIILFTGSVLFTFLRYFIHRSCGEINIPMRRSLVGPILYGLSLFATALAVPGSYILLAIPPLFYFLPKARKNPLESM